MHNMRLINWFPTTPFGTSVYVLSLNPTTILQLGVFLKQERASVVSEFQLPNTEKQMKARGRIDILASELPL
jgi:hypothetical protein